LILDGTLAPLLFSSVPAQATGTTRFVLLPEWPDGLEVGDRIERFDASPTAPSRVYTITAIQPERRLVAIDPPLPLGDTLVFRGGPVPFARLARRGHEGYASLARDLAAWRAAVPAREVAELDRLLNAVLVTTNPTDAAVAEAVGGIRAAISRLLGPGSLDALLSAFEAPAEAAVDDLLTAYRERGAERARDLLLDVRFRELFALGDDEASYSAAVQAALRAVAQSDVPSLGAEGPRDARTRRARVPSPDIDHVPDSEPEP
jgi:hypothetical protein